MTTFLASEEYRGGFIATSGLKFPCESSTIMAFWALDRGSWESFNVLFSNYYFIAADVLDVAF